MSNIPHIIHYCWFGGNAMPDQIQQYVAGWKQKLPEWQFMCWNESNFDISASVPYVQEAYAAKKYAFVSDYVRMCALRDYGGVYLDTDVEIRRDFSPLLAAEAENLVVAFESDTLIMTAFIACSMQNQIINDLIDIYADVHFLKEDGSFDELPNTDRLTALLQQHGLQLGNTEQVLENGSVHVYTEDCFSGYNMENSHPEITENTYTIHHFQSSWRKMSFKTWLKYKVVVNTVQKLIGYDHYDKLKAKLHL